MQGRQVVGRPLSPPTVQAAFASLLQETIPNPAARPTSASQDPLRRTALYERRCGARYPPCQGCHGAEANGHPLVTQEGTDADAFYRSYPALRGQKGNYLVTRLKEYREGTLAASSNAFIMVGVTRHLDDDSIDALAAWLSTMAP